MNKQTFSYIYENTLSVLKLVNMGDGFFVVVRFK